MELLDCYKYMFFYGLFLVSIQPYKCPLEEDRHYPQLPYSTVVHKPPLVIRILKLKFLRETSADHKQSQVVLQIYTYVQFSSLCSPLPEIMEKYICRDSFTLHFAYHISRTLGIISVEF